MSLIHTIELPILGDERGSLVAIESLRSVPFEIKRVYYIFGTQPNVARGFHAHKNLKQLVICLAGRCRFILDDGRCREEMILTQPNQGLLIENMIWREMHDFSPDCVLMVLADQYYNEKDYIRHYPDFLTLVTPL